MNPNKEDYAVDKVCTCQLSSQAERTCPPNLSVISRCVLQHLLDSLKTNLIFCTLVLICSSNCRNTFRRNAYLQDTYVFKSQHLFSDTFTLNVIISCSFRPKGLWPRKCFHWRSAEMYVLYILVFFMCSLKVCVRYNL